MITKALLRAVGSFTGYAVLCTFATPSVAQTSPTRLQADESISLSRVTGCNTASTPCSRSITIKDAAIEPVFPVQDYAFPYDTVNTDPRFISLASHFRRCDSSGEHKTAGRYCSVFEHVFEGNGVDSDQGIEGRAGTPSPNLADYSMACTLVKKDFSTSETIGEGNCMTISVRQGTGAAAGILSNVAAVKGFAATIESVTTNAFADFSPATRDVGLQMGVIDTRNAEPVGYGYIAIANKGALDAGVRVVSGGGSWKRAITNINNLVENFSVDGPTGAVTSLGGGTFGGVGTFGNGTAGIAALLVGPGRSASGPSYIDLFANQAAPSAFSARVIRETGPDGNLSIQNTGSGRVIVATTAGNVLMTVGNAARLTANATNVAFNGAVPAAVPTLPAALPTNGAATIDQVAAAYNAIRVLLIGYGLAN